MPVAHPDLDAVTRLIEQVGRDVVLPKFRALTVDDIEVKSSPEDRDDVVTVVDRMAEASLSEGLAAIAPEVRALGEEAAHREPALRGLLDLDAPLWVVDPIDGTRNFARGDDGFGMMVSWVWAGHVRASWIHLPSRGETFVAEDGSGAWLNGERLRVPPLEGDAPYRGMLSIRFLPEATREVVRARMSGRFTPVASSGAAAVGYTDIARGRSEFLGYYRLLPWDHGAPALLLTEAGGRVEHLDGRPYTIRSTNQVTIVARSPEVAREVRAWITAGGPLP